MWKVHQLSAPGPVLTVNGSQAPEEFTPKQLTYELFGSTSTCLTMVALEADRPLGDVDHQYYDELMRRLKQDTQHVQGMPPTHCVG